MQRTILLADDSLTIRKVVELAFREHGYRVATASSGEEAWERFQELKPDLVLADVMMPSPDGYELCRKVRGSEHPVPVLLLAGTFEPFDEAEARAAGAAGHLVKPFETRSLLARVRELLETPEAPPAGAQQDTAPSRADVGPEEAVEAALRDLEGGVATGVPEIEPEAAPPEASPEWKSHPAVAAPPVPPAPPEPQALHGDPLPTPAPGEPAGVSGLRLTPDEVDEIARAVVRQLSDRVIREIAWEVVPDLAEILIRERIRQLEEDAGE